MKIYFMQILGKINFQFSGGVKVPGKGRLQEADEGARRPPRPNSGLGRNGGENAMFELGLGIQGDIIW